MKINWIFNGVFLGLFIALVQAPLIQGQIFPKVFELATLNGTNGFTIYDGSSNTHSTLGYSVSEAGDVNGDGLDDIIVSAPWSLNKTGQCFVIFGTYKGFPATFDVSTIDGNNGFIIQGDKYPDGFFPDHAGISASGAGDINGDGLNDLIVGASHAFKMTGAVYVVYGASNFTSPFKLTSVETNGNPYGFVINSGVKGDDYLGHSISPAGDINQDGLDDILIGTFLADPFGKESAGKVYVLLGSASGFESPFSLEPLTTNGNPFGFVLYGINEGDQAGYSLGDAGDVNADGIDDIIIGAQSASPNGKQYAGQSYVVFGRPSGLPFPSPIPLGFLTNNGNPLGFVINGIHEKDHTGISVGGAGDINADGIDDFVIGAPVADFNNKFSEGRAYVLFGRPKALGFTSPFELETLLTLHGLGFMIKGASPLDDLGCSVSRAGDVNFDGLDDLIVGAYGGDFNTNFPGKLGAGESYIIYGSKKAFPTIFEVINLAGTNENGFVLTGVNSGEECGNSVSTAGDLNGDGLDDLLIGAPAIAISGNVPDLNRCYVVYGQKKPVEFVFPTFDIVLNVFVLWIPPCDITPPGPGWGKWETQIKPGYDLSVRISTSAGRSLPVEGVSQPPEHGTLRIKNGELIYSPNRGYLGQDTFSFYGRTELGVLYENTLTVEIQKDVH